jgi:hypothetical protein
MPWTVARMPWTVATLVPPSPNPYTGHLAIAYGVSVGSPPPPLVQGAGSWCTDMWVQGPVRGLGAGLASALPSTTEVVAQCVKRGREQEGSIQ